MNHSALTAHVRHAALAMLLLATSLPVAQAAAQAAAAAQAQAQAQARTQTQARVSAPRTLLLDEAFRLAEPNSDDVRIARNAVTRAKGQYLQARSTVLPQVTASANYSRQLQNQFTAISRRFAQPRDPNAPPDTGAQSFNPISILFQSPNTITLGLQASQPLYLDNRFGLAARVAKANESSAGYGFRTARAQLRYDIASAYFDAAIADRFLQIAESSLVQTERTLRQTTLQRQVGTVAEYDLLRSRVARDAQRPLVISAQQNRDVSVLRLKQLLNLPLTEPLVLATPIQDADMNAALAASSLDNETRPSAGTGLVANGAATMPPLSARDTAPASRTAVQQAAANVEVQKGAVENAALQRLPSLTLSTNYQRFAYPSNAQVIPRTFADFYPGWTVALGLTVPIWTSGRISGDVMVARANLADAQARLSQGKRAASLDVQLALRSLEQAEANWLSSVGTEQQADKALRIAEVRYTNGISTQLELSDIRNLLIQSQANQLTAARDLQLSRLRLTLLRDLPLGSGGGTSATGGTVQGGGAGTQQGGASTPQQGTSAGGTQTGATSSNGTTGRPE